MFLVYACPRCRRARVVQPGRKSATCASCSRALELRDLAVQAQAATLDEAQAAAGALNAKLAGRADEWERALVPDAPAAVRHDDRADAAAAATRRAASEKDRADLVARALGSFSRADLRAAFERAGLPEAKLEDHLKRMLGTSVVFEPRSGRYQAL